MSQPDTGTLVYLQGPKDIEFREYDLPEPERGAVLTEVAYSNVCGSDLYTWRGEHPIRTTGRMGHEAVCRVSKLGPGVTEDYAGEPLEVGDVVSPVYFIPCDRCSACQDGHHTVCENLTEHTTGSPDQWPHFTGTYATHYYIHPNQHFYKVPEAVDLPIAASANCALAQVLYGIEQVGIASPDTVVVQGAGGLGLNSIAVLKERGAEVIAIDGVDKRLRRAESFGADQVVDFREYETVDDRIERIHELTDGVGADYVVEVSGASAAVPEGIEFVRRGGEYLEMGNAMPGKTTELDPAVLTRNSIDVTTAIHYEPWYLRKALEFLETNIDRYPYDELVDADFDLVDVNDALEKSDTRAVTRATLKPAH